jgi:hypothetical protein
MGWRLGSRRCRGERTAILYTVLESAKFNGLDPEAYPYGEPITPFRTANSPTETFRLWPPRIRLRLPSRLRSL